MRYIWALKRKIMKHILKKLPWLIRAIIGFSLFMTFVYCVLIWPGNTICTLWLSGWASEKLSQYKQEVLALLIADLLSIIPALIAFFILRAYEVNEFVQVIAFWGVAIYAFSVVIDEERQRPYIWLWQKCRRLFKKKNYFIHTV